jgi:hypothetical protein
MGLLACPPVAPEGEGITRGRAPPVGLLRLLLPSGYFPLHSGAGAVCLDHGCLVVSLRHVCHRAVIHCLSGCWSRMLQLFCCLFPPPGVRVYGDSSRPLPWIDEDEETKQFVEYWFAEQQRSDLRRLPYALFQLSQSRLRAETRKAIEVLRLALSRFIITKDSGASLARDVSHSRPHKVAEASSFEVIPAFERSAYEIRRRFAGVPPVGNVDVRLGDARWLKSIGNDEVDVVLTSPPYLNAIDYMRGHRLSLVWLGYRLADLRCIRSNSIGAERGPDLPLSAHLFEDIQEAMGSIAELPGRHASMVARYAEDVYRLTSEVARVLKPAGRAIFVVGNSCLKGVFIRNSDGLIKAAEMVGLRLLHQVERELPIRKRYLPMPVNANKPLGKRMKTETILTFVPA